MSSENTEILSVRVSNTPKRSPRTSLAEEAYTDKENTPTKPSVAVQASQTTPRSSRAFGSATNTPNQSKDVINPGSPEKDSEAGPSITVKSPTTSPPPSPPKITGKRRNARETETRPLQKRARIAYGGAVSSPLLLCRELLMEASMLSDTEKFSVFSELWSGRRDEGHVPNKNTRPPTQNGDNRSTFESDRRSANGDRNNATDAAVRAWTTLCRLEARYCQLVANYHNTMPESYHLADKASEEKLEEVSKANEQLQQEIQAIIQAWSPPSEEAVESSPKSETEGASSVDRLKSGTVGETPGGEPTLSLAEILQALEATERADNNTPGSDNAGRTGRFVEEEGDGIPLFEPGLGVTELQEDGGYEQGDNRGGEEEGSAQIPIRVGQDEPEQGLREVQEAEPGAESQTNPTGVNDIQHPPPGQREEEVTPEGGDENEEYEEDDTSENEEAIDEDAILTAIKSGKVGSIIDALPRSQRPLVICGVAKVTAYLNERERMGKEYRPLRGGVTAGKATICRLRMKKEGKSLSTTGLCDMVCLVGNGKKDGATYSRHMQTVHFGKKRAT